MNEVAGRRSRSGGGASRRAERTAISFETARFIQRNIPNFEILNEEALQIIEHNAETVLEEIGVNFVENPAALARWRDAGADVQGERVHIPRGLARKLISTAPKTYTQHARNPERNVEVGGRSLVLAPVYGPPFVRDMEGGRRYATLEDFQNFVKLGYMSKWLHHSGGTVCEPTDIPVNKRHLDMLLAHMTLSDKPFMGSVTEPSRAQDSVDMAKILFGVRLRRPEHGDDQPHQHQLADGLRRDHDGRAGGLCRQQPGQHRLALHRRRRDGAGDGGWDADPGAGRDSGRGVLFAS
jgi:trimethylamine---corrinoid protein Co-methyltransferase